MRGILLLVLAICAVQIGRAYIESAGHKREREKLRGGLREEKATEDFQQEETVPPRQVRGKFADLYEINRDLIGWIFIEGTNIDYPVMQCGDDEYYLSHDFYGREDRYGCLYVKKVADVNTPGTNFIIYGHNMKDGSMFGTLDRYGEEDFCTSHPLISFDTLYDERTYEVMAVFRTQIKEEDKEFKYYRFYQADTEEEFSCFYENVKEMALYDTGVTAEYGDTFLTLSTCDYYADDGRFVVVAKLL